MAAAGFGYGLIVKKFTEEGVPAFCGRVDVLDGQGRPVIGRDGRPRTKAAPGLALGSGRWTRTYIQAILSDRRAVGELQPRLRDGTPAGDVVRIPAVVGEAEWQKARSGAAERQKRPGRVSDHVNIFAGLIKDAVTGSSYNSTLRRDGHRVTGRNYQKPPHRVLITHDATERRAPVVSFPLEAFEGGVLSLLREIDPQAVAGRDEPDKVAQIEGRKAAVRAKVEKLLAAVEADLDTGEEASEGTQRLLKKLEAEEKKIDEELRKARQAAACPRGEAWAEVPRLIDLATDPEARLRLRSVLRQNINEIRLLVVPRKRDRIAAVQVFFGSGERRDYIILARAALVTGTVCRRPASWHAKSLADVAALGPLDLRRPAHAARMAAALSEIDPDALLALLKSPAK